MRFFKILLCISMACLMTTPIFASSKSLKELAAERKRAQDAVRSTQSDINSTRSEMLKVQLEILELDETLIVANEDLDAINQSLAETIVRLEQTELELEQAQEERDKQFDNFMTRTRIMHEYGAVSYIDVLLNAGSIRDFLSRWDFVNSVAKSDREMAERLQTAEDKVSDKREELARQKITVQTLQSSQEAKNKELERTLEARGDYFKKLEADEVRYQAVLDQQKESEKSIQAEYNKAWSEEQAKEAARLKALPMPEGQHKWPVPSSTRITSHYGTRTHPINKRREHHTGVDISAKNGADIIAAEAGIVRTASRQGGYGNTVIIEHTGGMSTLYAHCSAINVSVGQSVTRGQVIAKIGSTGVSTGPHLHYEVRINGKNVSPKPYLGY